MGKINYQIQECSDDFVSCMIKGIIIRRGGQATNKEIFGKQIHEYTFQMFLLACFRRVYIDNNLFNLNMNLNLMNDVLFSDNYAYIVGRPCFLAKASPIIVRKYFEDLCGLTSVGPTNSSENLWYIKYCLSKTLYEMVKKQQAKERVHTRVAPPKPPRLQKPSPRLTRESISLHNQLQARGFGRKGHRQSPRKITGGFLMNNSRQKAK